LFIRGSFPAGEIPPDLLFKSGQVAERPLEVKEPKKSPVDLSGARRLRDLDSAAFAGDLNALEPGDSLVES
jgi:hypothetical protein